MTGANGSATATPPIKISVSGLSFYYGLKRALHDISIDVPANVVTAFIGPSGCGKSTFLRTLNRMNDVIADTRVEGRVVVADRDIYGPDVDVVALRRRVGMVFQRSKLFPKSVFENVAYGLRTNRLVESRSQLEHAVEKSLRASALHETARTTDGRLRHGPLRLIH